MGYDWNRGLTKEKDERVRKQSESLKRHYKTHPNPMKDKHHSEESNQKNSLSHIGKPTWNKGLPREKQPMYNVIPWNKGLHPSEKAIKKMLKALARRPTSLEIKGERPNQESLKYFEFLEKEVV